MHLQLKHSYSMRLGGARWVRPSVFGLGVALASLIAQGCGQASDVTEPRAPADLSAEDALRAVESCQGQARDCFVNGDAAVCEEQLRSCLLSALPDGGAPPRPEAGTRPPRPEGGTPPPRPQPDAGPPDDDHRPDAGNPNPPRDGGPPADPPSPDAGTRSLPDAARGALTDPVGNSDGGPAVHECVNDLRACLATGVRPSICAEESRACLSGLRDGG